MRLSYLLFLAMMLSFSSTKAQTDTSNVESDSLFVISTQPEYPGGPAEMYRFIQNNVTYPEFAREEGVEARVIVRFVIGKTGEVEDAVIAQYQVTPNDSIGESLAPLFKKEALRVVNAMPNWTPGKQRGQAIRVRLMLPISFKLQ